MTQQTLPNDLARSAMPRYLQLATLFRRRIETGGWLLHAQIPTVDELAAECGVARATIRKALGLLESEGLISRYRSKGTFVDKRPQDLLWLELATEWDEALCDREDVRIEVIWNRKGETPPIVPHQIGVLAAGYRHLRRCHWREDQPFLLADVYIDEAIAGNVDDGSFASLASMRFACLQSSVEIVDARQTLTIGTADLEIAELMKLPLNSPVAQVSRTAADSNGRIVVISAGAYRGDIIRVDSQLKC